MALFKKKNEEAQSEDEFKVGKEEVETKDAFQINECKANLMLCKLYLIGAVCGFIMLIAGILEVKMPASPQAMVAGGIVFMGMSPIYFLTKKCNGEKAWCKLAIVWGFLVLSTPLVTLIGNFTVMTLLLPMIMSIRYCNKQFTVGIVIGTVVAMILSVFIHPFIGGMDPSFYPFESGTIITITSDINVAMEEMNLSMPLYIKSIIRSELVPKLLNVALLAFISINIAASGRSMTEMQASISENSSRIETELNLATQIQAGMLPCVFPAFPEHEQIDLYACNVPAKEVGGDFYDYFRIDDDHIAIVMADVSGKGVGAALFMSISKIIIQNLMRFSGDIGQAMTESNASLCANNTAGMFVTAWVGVFEVSTGMLSYANAGHNPPVIVRKGEGASYLEMNRNFILAMMDGFEYKSESVQLNPGDEIFLYTDGVTEANDINGDMYGEDRLIECMNKIKNENAETQVKLLHQDIEVFEKGADQFDDITMLCLKLN